MNRCAYTGQPVEGVVDAIWDDGEWISWDYISSLEAEYEENKENFDDPLGSDFYLEALTTIAKKYYEENGRYLSIWGELGELYAEAKYGMRRHKPYSQGSDGRIGNDWVEVKTITPEKSNSIVEVKRAGNFNALIVVKIDSEFNFESRWIERKELSKGTGKTAKYNWKSKT